MNRFTLLRRVRHINQLSGKYNVVVVDLRIEFEQMPNCRPMEVRNSPERVSTVNLVGHCNHFAPRICAPPINYSL